MDNRPADKEYNKGDPGENIISGESQKDETELSSHTDEEYDKTKDSSGESKGSVKRTKLNKYLPIVLLNILILVFASFYFDKSSKTIINNFAEEEKEQSNTITLVFQDGASSVNGYFKNPEAPQYPRHAPVLTLSGSWHEMGKQYGRGCAGYILAVYEGYYEKWLIKPWGNYYLKQSLGKFDSQIKALSPEMTEFMKGIAEGASGTLKRSKYAGELTHYEKILFINVASEMLYFDEWHNKLTNKKDENPVIDSRFKNCGEMGTCWAALPRSTAGKWFITGSNRDADYFPSLYQIALRVYPEDKKYIPFLTTVTAGCVGSGNSINKEGLFVGYTGVGGIYRPGRGIEETGFGVPPTILASFLISGCSRVVDAKKIIAYGNKSYRQKTLRKTLLHSRGNNYLIASDKRALVVERTARHFSFRFPGNQKEFNNGYIVATNHFTCLTSYNDEGVESYNPMTGFGWSGKEADFSEARMLSVMHQLKTYYRRLNLNLAIKDINSLNTYFDNEDIEHTLVKKGELELPAREAGWSIDNQLRINNNPVAGTISAYVNLPNRGKMYFVLGSSLDWFGEWDVFYLDKESGPPVLPGGE